MYQWFIVNSTTGAIGTHSSTQSPLINNVFDPNLIPTGFTVVGPYDDTNPIPSSEQPVWDNPQAYLYQSGSFVANPNWTTMQLQQAKSDQIAQIRQGYTQTTASGFNVTIGTNQYTFGWSTDDKTNLLAVQEAITDGDLTFPVQYSDLHGSPVSIPDQTTLSNIKSTASRFFNNNHQQILNLIGQVQIATMVSAVQAIVWTPATY